MNINVSDLKYFLSVTQYLNISLAAKKVGISQPSLSMAIQRLESALNAKLLVRTKKGVILTQAGKKLQEKSKFLIEQWDNLKTDITSFTANVNGHYTIGCHPSVGIYSLQKFLPEVLEKYPSLEISLKHDLSRNITDQVIDLSIDIGIVVNPIRHPDLIIHHLWNDEVNFWSLKKYHRNTDIEKGTAVLLADMNLNQTQSLLKKLKKSQYKFSRIIHSSSLENMANLVLSGGGIAILPSGVVKKFDPQLKKLKMVHPSIKHKDEIALVYHMANKNIRAVQILVQRIRQDYRGIQQR